MKNYSIGVDFGTLSARAALVDVENGREIATATFAYPHGVMTSADFGESASEDVAYQHPEDYIRALVYTIREAVSSSGVHAEEIIGLGIDFTACTVLPALYDGTPLCSIEKYAECPSAYVKIWKHHGAESEARELTSLAAARAEGWLDIYGGKLSSEWLLPKLLETVRKAPSVINDADLFIEAADWLVRLLTGERVRSSCMAGYKACWNAKNGYPDSEYLHALDPRLAEAFAKLIDGEVRPCGTKAGCLNAEWANRLGLSERCVVTVPIIDAHAAIPACGAADKNVLSLIVGTSACHLIMSDKDLDIKGIAGKVENGVVDGLVAYEAGQSACGDMFAWFRDNLIPADVSEEAAKKGISVFDLLSERAEKMVAGESGIIVLDWWNGNRTPYMDSTLSGSIIGITTVTRPEHIYRGLLEGCAFGTRRIVELYENGGIQVKRVVASGGIPAKNPLLMQIFADVLGKRIEVSSAIECAAKGSAIMASVAANAYDSLTEACAAMSDPCAAVYEPDPDNSKRYEPIYKMYRELSEYFGKESEIMPMLRKGK